MLEIRGAYIRGGLIFGILRYFIVSGMFRRHILPKPGTKVMYEVVLIVILILHVEIQCVVRIISIGYTNLPNEILGLL